MHYRNHSPQEKCCICAGGYIESAAELAREHGVPPKTFRNALRKAKRSGKLTWREAIDGTRCRVLPGSGAHKDMLDSTAIRSSSILPAWRLSLVPTSEFQRVMSYSFTLPSLFYSGEVWFCNTRLIDHLCIDI